MDFPNDVPINIFKIDDVNKIYWSYHTNRRGGGQELDAYYDEGNTKKSLTYTERLLRENGRHVYREEHGLWIFSFSPMDDAGKAQPPDLDGLERSYAGMMLASAIDPSSKTASPEKQGETSTNASALPSPGQQTNVRAFNSNSDQSTLAATVQGNNPPMPSLAPRDLQMRCTSALTRSLSNSLAKGADFLRMGRNNCIETRTLADAALELEDIEPLGSASEMMSVAFEVHWVSSGALLIRYLRSSIPKLRRVSSLIGTDQSPGLPFRSLILLSPIGCVASYIGSRNTSENNDGHAKSFMKGRKAVTSMLLAEHNILVPSGALWIDIVLNAGPSEDNVKEAQRPMMTVWPAYLCLCKAMTPFTDYFAASSCLDADRDFSDPLAMAESWFAGKATRQATVKEFEQKCEAEATKASEPVDTEDEDVLSDFEFLVNQGATPQDVSGIYPTPPDGLAPNLHASPSGLPSHGSDGRTGPDSTSIPETANPHFHTGDVNSDLFDEMDMDDFTAKGLTEADFSFFDDPDSPIPEIQEGRGELAPGENAMNVHSGDISAIASNTNTPNVTGDIASSDDKSSAEEPIFDNIIESEAQTSLKQARNDIESETDLQLHIQDSSNLRDVDIGPVGRTHMESRNREIELAELPEALRDINSYGDRSANMDQKYATMGRYGFEINSPAKLLGPTRGPRHRNDALPLTGAPDSNDSLSDDTLATDNDEMHLVQTPIATEEMESADTAHAHCASRATKRKRAASVDFQQHSIPESPGQGEANAIGMPVMDQTEFGDNAVFSKADALSSPDYLARFFHEDMDNAQFIGKDKTFVQIAQTLADQIALATTLSGGLPVDQSSKGVGLDSQLEVELNRFASGLGKSLGRCTLKEFAALNDRPGKEVQQDINSSKQSKHVHPTKPPHIALPSVFELNCPNARVQRLGTSMDMSASATRLWEELSLEPAHKGKNVVSYCLYPGDLDIHDNVKMFLQMIKDAYQSSNLGSFDFVLGSKTGTQILPALGTERQGAPEYLTRRMREKCEHVGHLVGHRRLQGGSTAIYMTNFYGQSFIPMLCAGFLALFDGYNSVVKQQRLESPNDILLQIIPGNLVYSTSSIPIHSVLDYRKLAFETYDRCGANRQDDHFIPQYISAPAIRLARAIPRKIDLRLTTDSNMPLLQSDNCVHLSYAWSPGDYWLTASWTDNLGLLSWNAAYCFADTAAHMWRSFSDVAKEIWEITCDMMQQRNGPWKLLLCKDGVAYNKELETWQAMLSNQSKPVIVVTYLSINRSPVLDFSSRSGLRSISEYPLATPGATPQPSAPSPEVGSTPAAASVPISTPDANNQLPDGNDTEACLIDITNQAWGVILMNTANAALSSQHTADDVCRPVASAYILKRSGPRDYHGLERIQVDFLGGQLGHKMLVKEVLDMYAALGLLARMRGTTDDMKGMLPLHIAAARRVNKVLNATMKYGDG